ncbi:MAG TPA: ATP-binding protein [Herbaspirillum sp.]|jgi:two-component system C4-dicarboxylate transport sensor histidine kinase DctB
MRLFKNRTFFSVILVCFLLALPATYLIAKRAAIADTRANGERQLKIVALDLGSILDKFEILPYALGFQENVRGVLMEKNPDRASILHLNQNLLAIQQQSRVVAIYMMDRLGNTLAASNWQEPFSYVGWNFRFRPYFSEAMQGNVGRFYGIGNATGEPGYFIAQPVYARDNDTGGKPIGVMAVKINLAELEHAWSSSEDAIALADSRGVIFLSNRPGWRYHSLQPLGPHVQSDLAGTHQYGDQLITPVGRLTEMARHDQSLRIGLPIPHVGWNLMLFPSRARIERTASLWTLAMALALCIVFISAWAWQQRHRRLFEQRESRKALLRAAEELEEKIKDRTQQLMHANESLASRYAKLEQTQELLGSTQNELVQAGKLTMLGQMAAGMTHELSQPLAAIRAFAENAVKYLGREQYPQARQNLEHISDASARMGNIIAQLKGFARKSGNVPLPVDLAQSLETAALLLSNECEVHNVDVRMHVKQRAWIAADSVRIEQVLVNLLRNALDAVRDAPVREIHATLDVVGELAVMRIRDSGSGITEQAALRLFEPFFTTKETGGGLGLGLTISSSIVQAMNGQLSASNHPDGGAEFILTLPALSHRETQ